MSLRDRNVADDEDKRKHYFPIIKHKNDMSKNQSVELNLFSKYHILTFQ